MVSTLIWFPYFWFSQKKTHNHTTTWPVRILGWLVCVSWHPRERHSPGFPLRTLQFIKISNTLLFSCLVLMVWFISVDQPAERKRNCHKRSLQPRSAAVRDRMSSEGDDGHSTKTRALRWYVLLNIWIDVCYANSSSAHPHSWYDKHLFPT